MEKKRLTKTMWYGSDVDHAGNAILPEAAASDNHLSGLNEGEIYIHNHPDNPSIWTRTTDGKIVSISGVDISVLEKLFLSKTKDDRSKGKIASDKAIEVGNYVSGASGAIIYKDAENGQTVAEFDKLYVRMKAYFETLEIINVNTIGGKQIISPAGSVRCIGVEETDNAYRCYFLAEQDGEKVQNRFLVYDQIYSQMFDAVEGTSQNVSTHYFWRLCIAKSKEPVTFENKSCHYIDLSKSDCDSGSDVPMVGDVLNQRGNRTELDRMNFIEMSSVDAFSPNITLFHGVNSYSLDGKAYVSYGVDKSTNKAFMDVYGDMYVGDRQKSSYMRYTQENGLEISGTLSVGTKLGDTPLKDLISASSPEGYQEFVEKVTQDIEGLQAQIDGAIESYFFQYDPTLGNYPASEWITEEQKKAHLNDTFTNLISGYSWRWTIDNGVYGWTEITDTATSKALALAGQAKDTADGKRRVFVDTPYPPYDKGDLWSRGSEYPLMICVQTKDKNGVYNVSDFDYADNNAKLKEEMQDLVGETKDELNNAIGQAKNEAVNNANAYTDQGKQALQESIDALEQSKANLDAVYTKAEADGKISKVEEDAINAAKAEADAAIAVSETIIKAYADGVVDKEEAARIKQAQENLEAAKKYAEEQAQIAIDEANDTYGYLAKALGTEVDGGLLLTSLIQMRDTDQNIMSGINGLTAKGDKSIATWWGGGMHDMFDYYDWDGAKWAAKKNIQIPANVPSGVIRMDGTGYLAKGKFWWDESGKIYADPTALFLSFDVEAEAGTLSATIVDIRDKQTEFADMWEFKTDANGRKYLLSKYPLVTQEGITMYSGVGTTIPSIYDGLPIDGVTIYWENGILKAQGGGSEGINEEQLENYLTINNYAKKSDIPSLSGYQPLITSSNKLAYSLISGTPTLLSSFTNDSGFITASALNDYLPLSGGTLTSTSDTPLALKRNVTNSSVSLKFSNSTETLGYIGFMGHPSDAMYKQPIFADNTNVYKIYHSGNFNPSDYLPKSGGTLTGVLTLSSGYDKKLILDNTDNDSKYQYISFRQNGTEYGALGTSFDDNLLWNQNYILHSQNYSSYALPLSGGTIKAEEAPLTIHRDMPGSASYIIYKNRDEELGRLGFFGGWNTNPYEPFFADKNGNNRIILHSGNYSDYTLPLTGGNIGDGTKGVPLILTGNQTIVELQLKSSNGTQKGSCTWQDGYGVFMYNYTCGGLLGIKDDGTPVYGNNTLIHSGNIGSQSVANADKLDGKHDGELTAQYFSQGALLTKSNTINTLMSGVYSYINGDNPTGAIDDNVVLLAFRNLGRTDMIQLAGAANTENLYYRRAANVGNSYEHWTNWKTIAFTDSNVASATKLENNDSYTAWGQTFFINGKPNSFNGTAYFPNGDLIYAKDEGGTNQYVLGFTSSLGLGYGSAGAGYDTYVLGNNVYLRYSTSRIIGFSLTSSGNVGIGTISPSYKLDVSGNIYSSSDIVSYYSFFTNAGREGCYLHGTGISWHNSSNSWTHDLFTYSSATDMLTAHRVLGCLSSIFMNQSGNGIYIHADGISYHNSSNDWVATNIVCHPGGGVSLSPYNGYVGIGILSPSYKLDVYGEIHASGNAYLYGGSIFAKTYLFMNTDAEGIYFDTNGLNWHDSSNGWTHTIQTYQSNGTTTFHGEIAFNAGYSIQSYNSTPLSINKQGNNIYLCEDGYGNVGIGTTSPSAKLHVNGAMSATSGTLSSTLSVTGASTFTGKTNHNGGLESTVSSAYAIYGNSSTSRVCIAGDNGKSLYIASKGNSADYYLVSVNYGQTTLGSGGSNAFTIRGDGNVGIGQNAPSAKLHVAGNILTSGSITMNSMRSMKNIINENGLSLEELSAIKPTRFTWKDGRDDRIHVGGIADDVMKVLPEVVFKGSDGVLSMDYASAAFVMAASLIQPMTEHERRIANLERENALLKEEIRNLKSA